MKIYIPNNNIKEREYILNVFFIEFLDVKFQIELFEKDYWLLELPNGNTIQIKDAFFNKFKSDLEYLKTENIPEKIQFSKNNYILEKDLPVIFGATNVKSSTNTILCDIDVFASAFFMLTRWEEHVLQDKDKHQRFPGNKSLAFRNNFLNRPVVNEYLEFLWNMMQNLGYSEKRKSRAYELIVTHDVDYPFNWKTPKKTIRRLGGRLIKLDIKNFFVLFINLIQTLFNYKKDYYYKFDFLFDAYKQRKLTTYFFLMTGKNKKLDGLYDYSNLKIKELLNNIASKGHKFGFHPGYDSYFNKDVWTQEYKELTQQLNEKVSVGRQHFLRMDIPKTLRIWEANNMQWDSSLYYSKEGGFRTGCCYAYPIFDFLERKQLNLLEKTLCFMDTTIIDNDRVVDLKELSNKVKKYKGEFVFLWHNSNLYNKKLRNIFIESLDAVV